MSLYNLISLPNDRWISVLVCTACCTCNNMFTSRDMSCVCQQIRLLLMCAHSFKWLYKVKCESQKNYQHHTTIHKYDQMLMQFKQCSLIWVYATSRQWVPLPEGQITNQQQQTLLKLHLILWLGGISDAATGILNQSFQSQLVLRVWWKKNICKAQVEEGPLCYMSKEI